MASPPIVVPVAAETIIAVVTVLVPTRATVTLVEPAPPLSTAVRTRGTPPISLGPAADAALGRAGPTNTAGTTLVVGTPVAVTASEATPVATPVSTVRLAVAVVSAAVPAHPAILAAPGLSVSIVGPSVAPATFPAVAEPAPRVVGRAVTARVMRAMSAPPAGPIVTGARGLIGSAVGRTTFSTSSRVPATAVRTAIVLTARTTAVVRS